jgi:hypothetical protein
VKPPDDAPVNPIDRDLVDAFAALDRTVPEESLEDFAARVAARLDLPEGADVSRSSPVSSPPVASRPVASLRAEDSGLHDIKALASSAKRRASERDQSESDVGESYLLTAAQGGLRAVALPGSGDVAGAESASDRGPGTRADARSSAPFWILGSVASLAAVAAVAVFVFGIGRNQEAMTGAAPAGQGEVVARAEPTASAEVARVEAPAARAEEPAAAETVSPEPVEPPPRVSRKPEAESSERRSGGGRDRDDEAKQARPSEEREARTSERRVAEASKEEPASSSGGVPTAEELGLPPEEGSPPAGGAAPGPGAGNEAKPGGGDVSLDDMLDEVAGKKPPPPPPPPDSPDSPKSEDEKKKEKPEKKELDRREVTRALEEVRGAVEKCHDVERFTGVVTVKFAVAPSGQVSSSVATGAHARSRTGSCVAAAVKQARFEAFEGSPISFTLPFRLPGAR